jgi:4-cresol dehydrogenase (hydroxylating)
MPKPHDFVAFFFQTDLEKNLKPLIDALRPLRLGGIIESSLHIGNDVRVLSHMQQHPWEATDYKTPLPESVKNNLKRKWNVQALHGSGAFYGTPQQNADSRKLIKKALMGIAKVYFITDHRLRIIYKLKDILKMVTKVDLSSRLSMLSSVYGVDEGYPHRVIHCRFILAYERASFGNRYES